MGIILDLIVVAVIAICALISAKHGFVRTAIEVVGFIAAFIIAFTFSSPLAAGTYDKMVEPAVVSAIENAAADTKEGVTEAIWSAMPEFVTNNEDLFGVDKESVSDGLVENTIENVADAANAASQTVVRPLVVKVLGFIYSTVILVVLLFVVKILAKLINKLFSFSIVGSLNKTLGGVLGIIKGVAIAAVLCMIISLIVSFTQNGFLIFTADNISDSTLFKSLSQLTALINK